MIPYYVYKITLKSTGQYYFGSRFKHTKSNIQPENDIWIRYFTSSKYIKKLIFEFGINEFAVEILKKDINHDIIFWAEQELIAIHFSDSLLMNKHYKDKNTGQKVFSFSGMTHTDEFKLEQSNRKKKLYKEHPDRKNSVVWTEEMIEQARERQTTFWLDNPDKLVDMKQKKIKFSTENPDIAINQGLKLKAKHLANPELLDDYRKRAIKQHADKPQLPPFICIETSQIFTSLAEAGRTLDIHYTCIGKVLNGKSLSTRGYTFKYLGGS